MKPKAKTEQLYIPELRLTVSVKPGATVKDVRAKYLSHRDFKRKQFNPQLTPFE